MNCKGLLAVVLVSLLAACSRKPDPQPPAAGADAEVAAVAATVTPAETTPPPPTVAAGTPQALDTDAARAAALEVVDALKRRDMATVARYAHPTMGVLFAPYAFVEPSEHQVWSAAALPNWFQDTRVRVWGTEDGTGFPIERTPAQYYERFVFPRDFTAGAKISVNDDQAKGNSINNAPSLYPDGVRVEFYLPPTETPEGPLPDWRALRLVFVGVGGEPKLVAVVHDQWTI